MKLNITTSEMAMLLLCGNLGDGLQPCGIKEFRELEERTLAKGCPLSQREIKKKDFIRLGYSDDDAERFIALLDREEYIDDYLGRLADMKILPITRLSPGYPARFYRLLKDSSPTVMFFAGELTLLDTDSIGLVGPRKASTEMLRFSRSVGERAANQNKTLVSGGAIGCDSAGEKSALKNGGKVISFTAQNLVETVNVRREELETGRLLILSETGADLDFTTPRAFSRNRLIHTLPEMVFVAGAELDKGGSWSGTVNNLKHNYSKVYVNKDGSPASECLMNMGAVGIKVHELESLENLPLYGERNQMVIF